MYARPAVLEAVARREPSEEGTSIPARARGHSVWLVPDGLQLGELRLTAHPAWRMTDRVGIFQAHPNGTARGIEYRATALINTAYFLSLHSCDTVPDMSACCLLYALTGCKASTVGGPM